MKNTELNAYLTDMSDGAMKMIMLSVITDNVDCHTDLIEKAKNKVITEFQKRTNSKFTQTELDLLEDTANYINDCVDLIKISDNGSFDFLIQKLITESSEVV